LWPPLTNERNFDNTRGTELLVLHAERLAPPGRAPAMKTSLRLIRSESSALALPVAEKMEAYIGCVVVQTLAMSECSERSPHHRAR
jgi:hypothetical protein